MLITFEKASTSLSPHFQNLWGMVDGAWKDYQTLIPAEARAIASTRSRASFVHDFMVKRAHKIAETNAGIHVSKYRMMFALVFSSGDDFIAMRLKKLDEDGISKNNPTIQSTDFRNQISIPGIPARHHLEIGYILNPTQDSISSIELVCPSGRGNYWMAEVTPADAKENLYNLWEQRGEEEQSSTGFIVKRRSIDIGEDNAANDSN